MNEGKTMTQITCYATSTAALKLLPEAFIGLAASRQDDKFSTIEGVHASPSPERGQSYDFDTVPSLSVVAADTPFDLSVANINLVRPLQASSGLSLADMTALTLKPAGLTNAAPETSPKPDSGLKR